MKKNKTVPINLIINGLYPFSDHSDVIVELKSDGDAIVERPCGFLTWKTDLLPGDNVQKVFSHKAKYPPHMRIY